MRLRLHLSFVAAVRGAALVVVAGLLLAGPAAAVEETPGQARLLVKFRPAVSADDRRSAVAAAGVELIGTVHGLDVSIASVPAAAATQALAALQHNPAVDYAEADGHGRADETIPNDTDWASQWGPRKIAAPQAWDVTRGSSAVVVAVVDSGVDPQHPDLSGALLPGKDFINNDLDATDDYGHGTKVAGIVAARTNNARGVAGTCWTCSILPVKVIDSTGYAPWSAVASGITWATDQGADVINLSLGGTAGSTTLHSAVRYASDRGVLLVGSAGNTGDTAVRYPSGYAEVVAVSGSDSADNRYSWSTHGSWVELAAPGCNYTTVRGGATGSFCGTSSAAPVASGVAGLLRAAQPTATAAQLTSALTSSAVAVSYVSAGRVDAAGAMAAISVASEPPAEQPTETTTQAPATEAPATEQPATATVTSTFTGSMNGKNPAPKTHTISTGAGEVTAQLTAKDGTTFSLDLRDSAGVVLAETSGGSRLSLTKQVAAGDYQLLVAGTRGSYTLTVTYPRP